MTPLLHLDVTSDPTTPRYVPPPLVGDYDPAAVLSGVLHQVVGWEGRRTECGQPVHEEPVAAWRAIADCAGRYCPVCYPPVLPWGDVPWTT